jgi:hypothetical protein
MITLNVNGLNFPIKSYRAAEWIKNSFNYMLPTKELTSPVKNTHRKD